jgi:outer membrane biosynthesis protein TonB
MHCWNCGTRNPDENSFCGRCGRRIASTSTTTAENDAATLAAADAAPPQTNPLVEEPRAVHDSPRVIAQMETARSTTLTSPPPAEPPATELPAAQPTARETLPPLQMSRPVRSDRITGPSFLGLSDESTGSGDSDYLLYDDEPERSSWRGWLAFAVLVLLGFLVYKQWNAVSSGAQMLAQRASGEIQQTATPQKPAPTVTGSDQSNGASQTPPPNSTTPQPPADNSSAKKDDSVNKPEADHTADSETTAKDESAASKNEPAATSKDKDVADDTVSPAPAKEEKKPTADDEDSQEATPAKAAAKATTPAEPKFNDAQIEEAQRYLTGQGGTRQDCGRAISLLRSSAREGNPRAQVKLGALYATGQCVTQDRAAAYEWLARAQETQPHNTYLQRTMSSLWANMTPEERSRITK